MWIKKIFKGITIFLVVAVITSILFGVVMYYRNPSTEDLIDYLKTEELLDLDEDALDQITLNDYFVFSVFEYEITKDETRYLGVNNSFVLIDPKN